MDAGEAGFLIFVLGCVMMLAGLVGIVWTVFGPVIGVCALVSAMGLVIGAFGLAMVASS